MRAQLSGEAQEAAQILARAQDLRRLAALLREEIAARHLRLEGCAARFMTGGLRPEEREAEEVRLIALRARRAACIEALTRQERTLERALFRLAPRDCLLLELRWRRGMRWEEIARRLYVSERTARRGHVPALRAFYAAWTEECGAQEGDPSAEQAERQSP